MDPGHSSLPPAASGLPRTRAFAGDGMLPEVPAGWRGGGQPADRTARTVSLAHRATVVSRFVAEVAAAASLPPAFLSRGRPRPKPAVPGEALGRVPSTVQTAGPPRTPGGTP